MDDNNASIIKTILFFIKTPKYIAKNKKICDKSIIIFKFANKATIKNTWITIIP